MILMDSDVAIDIVRNMPPAVDWFGSVDDDEPVAVSGFTAMELVAGSTNLGEQRTINRWLERLGIAWLTEAGCDHALALFADYHLSHGIGIYDALIAQTAIEMSVPLYTFNVKHYRFVPGLALVQPYERSPRRPPH